MKLSRILIFSLALLTISCQRQPMVRSNSAPRQDASGGQSVVSAITLPRYQFDLPAAPGRDVFAVACVSCHSSRYVTNQPPLSAAKWDEEVRKMIKNYGA